MEPKKLTRSMSDKSLCGVCSGLAKYFNIDVALVRIIYAVLTFFSAAFPGIILYIICALILPPDQN